MQSDSESGESDSERDQSRTSHLALGPSSPNLTVSLDRAGKQPCSSSAQQNAKFPTDAPSNKTSENDENIPPSTDAHCVPPSTSQVPRPPTPVDPLHEKNLANAQGLRRIRTWKTLVSRILNQFPHPNTDKRPDSSWPQSYVSERRQYVTLMLVCQSLSSCTCYMNH